MLRTEPTRKTYLSVPERGFEAKVELQGSDQLTLLCAACWPAIRFSETNIGGKIRKKEVRTTATLVRTERASQARVTGGICANQASKPTTGIWTLSVQLRAL